MSKKRKVTYIGKSRSHKSGVKTKGYLSHLSFHMVQDVGSGLNTARRGLLTLCRLIEAGKVGQVVVTYKDRLTRFGFDYLTRYFSSHGATVSFLQHKEAQSLEEELVQDVLAIISSFSGRIHGMRSHRNHRNHRSQRAKRRQSQKSEESG